MLPVVKGLRFLIIFTWNVSTFYWNSVNMLVNRLTLSMQAIQYNILQNIYVALKRKHFFNNFWRIGFRIDRNSWRNASFHTTVSPSLKCHLFVFLQSSMSITMTTVQWTITYVLTHTQYVSMMAPSTEATDVSVNLAIFKPVTPSEAADVVNYI